MPKVVDSKSFCYVGDERMYLPGGNLVDFYLSQFAVLKVSIEPAALPICIFFLILKTDLQLG